MALVTEAKAIDYVKIAVIAWLGVLAINRLLAAVGLGQFATRDQSTGG